MVYPTVKLFGYDMLASPSAKLTNVHPAITAFEVTDSEHKSGAFMNDGRYYDYKFDVALTAEIDNLEGVADWGYVYRDPYGNIKRISLMEFGQAYTDTRYAYYRNEAHSTACLYTYVRYEGDSEYYDGEPHDYPLDMKVLTCPDDHHPHAIDLGLPSGTKWACCNIGATSPEGYGGYYAWGETSEKDDYDRDINPAKRNVLDLKNETCKNREKRNVLKISHTRYFKAIKKQSVLGCFYSF